MSSLLIKDLPEALHRKLWARARAHRRSLGKEALVLIEEALDGRAGPPTLARIDARRVHGRAPLTQRLLDEARKGGRP
jgi:plasmid stability protein